MDSYPPILKRSWKRDDQKLPFPHTWRKFILKSPDGDTYKIRIQDLCPDQREEVWNLYEKHFFPDEELIRSSNALEDVVTMKSQKWVYDQCVKENMSIIAVLDNEDPKPTIVGALTLEVISKEDPPNPTTPGAARAKFQNLFKILRKDVNEFEKLNIDKYFSDYAVVIKSEYRRLGLGSELFKTMEEMAKIFEIPAAVIIFNNNKSQALSAKLGYTVLNEVNVKDHVDENGKPILPTVDTKVVQVSYKRFL